MPYRRSTSDPASGGVNWSPRDMLIPYVLLAIALQRAHGYLIEEYLKSLGFFNVDMSTLYRTLRQLEHDGLLLSEWETGQGGPARRVYTLTDAGRAWMDAWVATLDTYRAMIDTFFSLYTDGVTQNGAASASAADAETTERT